MAPSTDPDRDPIAADAYDRLADDSVDVVPSALALGYVVDLADHVAEFARVLEPRPTAAVRAA